MKHLLTTLIIVLSITNILSAQDGPLVAGEGEKKVITSGYGKNPDEALTQALRNAVEEAVGTYMTSTTRIENDELIEDKVLSLSRGFIKDFKKLAEMKVEDETKVTISAIVTEDQIIETLTASGVEVKISGGLMFAQFMDMEQQMKDERNLVASLFKDPPENSPYDLEISYSNPVEKGDKYNIELEVTIKFNENYYILLQNLKGIFNEIAFDHSDIHFPYPTYIYPFPTRSIIRPRTQDVKDTPLMGSSSMYKGSSTDDYIIFSNLSKETLYNKELSESDYLNIQNRYKGDRGYIRGGRTVIVQGLGQDSDWSFNREGKITDLFKKGVSPYIVGIMISDTDLRIYRFLHSISFSLINSYLKTYLYHIDFSISQILSEKLKGMENSEIVHTFSLDLQPTPNKESSLYLNEGEGLEGFVKLSKINQDYLEYGKKRDIYIEKKRKDGVQIVKIDDVWYSKESTGTIMKYYYLPDYRDIITPQRFLTIPPAIGWNLALSDRGRVRSSYWGKITFLPFQDVLKLSQKEMDELSQKEMDELSENLDKLREMGMKVLKKDDDVSWGILPQTFATIENINLEITADVLSKLTSIIIAIK